LVNFVGLRGKEKPKVFSIFPFGGYLLFVILLLPKEAQQSTTIKETTALNINGEHYDDPTDAEIELFRQQQMFSNNAFWNKKATKTVKVSKPHICEKCSKVILIGSRAKRRSEIVGTGWPFSLVTKYSHEVCP
jgi:hypothetical protein